MDYFESEKAKEKEAKMKRVFLEQYQKQMKYTKKVVAIIFACSGIFFCFLGLVLMPTEGLELMVAFLSIGVIFIILAVLLLAIFSSNKLSEKAYERYVKYKNKYGISNVYCLSAQMSVYEEQLQELEARVEELEQEIDRLKRKS